MFACSSNMTVQGVWKPVISVLLLVKSLVARSQYETRWGGGSSVIKGISGFLVVTLLLKRINYKI